MIAKLFGKNIIMEQKLTEEPKNISNSKDGA
jgi:hypothetical protein